MVARRRSTTLNPSRSPDDPAARAVVVQRHRPAEQRRHQAILQISGHVNTPCVVEEAMGITFRELIDTHCGGIRGGWDNLLAVIPGGSSVPCVPAEQIMDAPMDFDGCARCDRALAPPP
jgi:NADH-quinone oxidoreductase subunit F